MKVNRLKKGLMVCFALAACLIAGGFIKSGWEEYQARKKFNQVKMLVSTGKNADRKIANLEESLPALAKDSLTLKKYGALLSKMERTHDAIRIYEQAQKAACSPDTLIILSNLYLETKQFDKSIASARQALDILPWKLIPRFTLASAYLEKGNKQKAFQYCLDTIVTPEKRISRDGLELKQQARKTLPFCVPEKIPLTKNLEAVVSGIGDPDTRKKIKLSLMISGENRAELEKALLKVSGEKLNALIFLLANMPEPDLQKLDSSYLLENIDCAYEVRNVWPFMPDIPEEIFLNYLLPYAQIGETRDDWRQEFMKRYLPIVENCKSAGEIVLSLQTYMPNELVIMFDQDNTSDSFWSVGDTIKNKKANCISLSVLVADACRSVGIPARVVTIPRWKDVPGGHTWVEIYDQGKWRHIGAFEAYPLDNTWFNAKTSATDDSNFMHRIYAASFSRTDIQISRYGSNTWWTDVTANYVK